ncbi:MAG: LLM class flavin-dependent oxidoreductase [Chloroflexi bacterium]|nr:LLM class flavin-dependent oxidoreductase [Chloroflexota bacterium]
MARVGYALGYGKFTNAREIAELMAQAEGRGFEMAFFSETIELMRDSVTCLAAIGMSTKKMILGSTQIVRLRTPIVMAQSLASLDELTGGRMTLAPGACTASHARVHGLDQTVNPARSLKEWIESMRLVLTGEKVSYNGEYVQFNNVGLGWKPIRPSVPLYVPATSATGLRLAGTVGDGVVLNAVCSPEYTVNALKIVRAAAEKAGKDWSKFEVAQIINVSVEDDHKAALDAIRWEVATKLDPVQIPFIVEPKLRVGEPYFRREDVPMFEEAWKRGGMEALIKVVPDSYVEGMTASGTPDEVIKRVQQYRDAGVRVPLLRPAAAHQTQRVLEMFTQK